MKCSWPGTCKMFWPYLPKGRSRARQNRSQGGPLLQKTSSSDLKATATNRIHSSDLDACVMNMMKCCCFWFHSVVKFLNLESSLLQKCSLYSGERSVPLGALVYLLAKTAPSLLVRVCWNWNQDLPIHNPTSYSYATLMDGCVYALRSDTCTFNVFSSIFN